MNNKKIDLANFDFSQFRSEAIEQVKSDQSYLFPLNNVKNSNC